MKKTALIAALFLMLVAPAAAGINSVDEVNFKSNGNFFNGEVFVFDFTADGNTDKVNVYVGADKLTENTDMGEVQNSIKIDATSTETKAKYSFNSQKELPINNYNAIEFELEKASIDFGSRSDYVDYIESEIKSKCYDMDGGGISTYDYLAYEKFKLYDVDTGVKCFSASKKAGVAEISSDPRAIFSTTWEISNGERTVTTTVSNGETGTGTTTRVGNDVLIEWKGSIGTGKNAPVPTDELIAYSNSEGYRIIKRGAYDNYVDTVRDPADELKDWHNGLISESAAEETFNREADDAYSPHSTTEFESPNFNGNSFESGSMTVTIPSLRFPEFSIYANACEGDFCDAFIKIKRTVGKPAITSTSGDKFKELSSGTIEATIKNVGSAEGSFSARLTSCSTGFSFTGSAERFSLQEGRSRTVSFPVSFDSSSYDQKQVSGSCTVEVTETSTGTSVTETASVTGVQMNECSPGNTFVKTVNGKDKVLKCTGDGLQTEVIKTCAQDEHATQTSSGYKCVKDNVNPPEGECEMAFGLKNPACVISNAWDNITGGLSFAFFLLDLSVTFAAGIGGWFVSTNYLYPLLTEPVKKLKNPAVQIGMGVVGFVLAGSVVYTFFTMWWVKLLIVIGGALFLYVYGAAEALIPG